MALAADSVGICKVKDASRILRIPLSTLNSWDEHDFIRPKVMSYHKRKPTRLYTFQDLVALRVAFQLRQAGISLQALRRVVRYLQEKDGSDNPLSTLMLVAIGNDVYECKNETELYSVLKRPGQAALRYVLDIGQTVKEVRQELTDHTELTAA